MKPKPDWKIIVCYLLLVLIGWISIYSAGHSAEGALPITDIHSRAGKQLLWIGISIITGLVILFLIKPYLWEVISTPAYALVLFLLLLTIIFGTEINGSKSWFKLGPVSFQPCEISKICTSLLLAHFLRYAKFSTSKIKDLLVALSIIGLPALLILAEKETGTVLIYTGYIFVLYREGLSGWWILLLLMIIFLFVLSLKYPLWVAFAVLAAGTLTYYLLTRESVKKSFSARRQLRILSLMIAATGTVTILCSDLAVNHILKPHQKQRVEVLLGIKDDLSGAGYNVNQSMIAIGSGGLKGKGFLSGTQTTYGFVPEQSTDFIFCTIGEEWGFIGCFIVIAVFAFFLYRILKVAEECRDPFNRIYGYCIASCFFMHFFINIGMTIGLMPVIGIPLPFISYGGTSLLSFTVMLSIFLSLVKHEKRYF